MDSIEVPTTVILDSMMQKLQLPCPQYKDISVGDFKFTSEVLFYPSVKFLEPTPQPHSVSSHSIDSYEMAKNNAALKAIRYMEKMEKKTPVTYTDAELEYQKKKNRAMDRRLAVKIRKLEKNKDQLFTTGMECDVYTDKVFLFADRINDIVSKNLPPTCANKDDGHPLALATIKTIVAELQKETTATIRKLRSAGMFPFAYGEEGVEGGTSSDSRNYDSDAMHRDSFIYDWDSDGNRYDEDRSNE